MFDAGLQQGRHVFYLVDKTGDALWFCFGARLLLGLQLELIDQQSPHLLVTETGYDLIDVFCAQGLRKRNALGISCSCAFLGRF